MKNLFYLMLTFFVLTSCTNDENEIITENEVIIENDVVTNNLQFTTVGQNSLHGAEEIPESGLVFNNEAEWNIFLTQVNSINNLSYMFNETNIDFSEFTVIAVIEGIKTSGSEINITNVNENDETIQISKELTMYASAVISQPFHIIKIPKTNKEIIFE